MFQATETIETDINSPKNKKKNFSNLWGLLKPSSKLSTSAQLSAYPKAKGPASHTNLSSPNLLDAPGSSFFGGPGGNSNLTNTVLKPVKPAKSFSDLRELKKKLSLPRLKNPFINTTQQTAETYFIKIPLPPQLMDPINYISPYEILAHSRLYANINSLRRPSEKYPLPLPYESEGFRSQRRGSEGRNQFFYLCTEK